ncbi:hypothetical protein [Nocardia colli]|uniref:hypothetical protein n=1 Tax=Nocardia colli TaxID=2545717 RepID=UPI0035D57E9E
MRRKLQRCGVLLIGIPEEVPGAEVRLLQPRGALDQLVDDVDAVARFADEF